MFLPVFLSIVSFLLPATMVLFGILFIKRPPQDINSVFGYRTRRSSQSKAAWDFAHRCSGRFWLFGGILTAILSGIVVAITHGNIQFPYIVTGIMGLDIAVLLLVIPYTEIQLKRNF